MGILLYHNWGSDYHPRSCKLVCLLADMSFISTTVVHRAPFQHFPRRVSSLYIVEHCIGYWIILMQHCLHWAVALYLTCPELFNWHHKMQYTHCNGSNLFSCTVFKFTVFKHFLFHLLFLTSSYVVLDCSFWVSLCCAVLLGLHFWTVLDSSFYVPRCTSDYSQ